VLHFANKPSSPLLKPRKSLTDVSSPPRARKWDKNRSWNEETKMMQKILRHPKFVDLSSYSFLSFRVPRFERNALTFASPKPSPKAEDAYLSPFRSQWQLREMQKVEPILDDHPSLTCRTLMDFKLILPTWLSTPGKSRRGIRFREAEACRRGCWKNQRRGEEFCHCKNSLTFCEEPFFAPPFTCCSFSGKTVYGRKPGGKRGVGRERANLFSFSIVASSKRGCEKTWKGHRIVDCFIGKQET